MQPLLLEDEFAFLEGLQGQPLPQRASSVRPGSSERLNEKSRFL